MNLGVEVRGAHASKPAKPGAADSVEDARKIKVGPAPPRLEETWIDICFCRVSCTSRVEGQDRQQHIEQDYK